jgi:hypothetical protein
VENALAAMDGAAATVLRDMQSANTLPAEGTEQFGTLIALWHSTSYDCCRKKDRCLRRYDDEASVLRRPAVQGRGS